MITAYTEYGRIRKMSFHEDAEKLSKRMNVPVEEAESAIAQTNGDVLDAMMILESQPKTITAASKADHKIDWAEVRTGGSKLLKFLKRIIEKGNENKFVVLYKQQPVFSLSITSLVLLLLLIRWWLIGVIIVSLFFGIRYTFRGPNVNEKVNRVVKQAADLVDSEKNL